MRTEVGIAVPAPMAMRVRTRRFGDALVPVIGQGTWNMEQDARDEVVRALRRGLDLGLTHVDTAELYGSGRVEEIVREAIAGRRDEVFLVSKVLPSNASRRGTIEACERSLARLGTDRLDAYLLHWPGSFPLEETIEAFEELVRAGKIVRWGVSNFDEEELEDAQRIAGDGRIACNQVLHHLQERAIEHAVAPWCAARGVAVVSYSPFGSGEFPAAGSKGGKVLAEIARAHGATPRQVALAFLLQVVPGALVIPKASKVAHVEDNAGAMELVLDDDEIAHIDAVFPKGKRRRGVPTL
ncbi:Oxidoreductase, aldo/keto reductase family [Sandaracinus amylolyticus]|uniref:Oxidoreductase, aldo/keto reductase family n=1 Tax=Sandaracinus amylolyticus TaxID=927083 RepID=A0A0F6SH13_9BACT|nr:aldo/keto reductase [Sandaracinus amylolyticus]AKF09644.1 Oxidoreductase, aldo/keto reductase family [Sandaracinus amylolyticus]